MVRQAPVICVMAPPIHLGAWSMALMPFELLLLCDTSHVCDGSTHSFGCVIYGSNPMAASIREGLCSKIDLACLWTHFLLDAFAQSPVILCCKAIVVCSKVCHIFY